MNDECAHGMIKYHVLRATCDNHAAHASEYLYLDLNWAPSQAFYTGPNPLYFQWHIHLLYLPHAIPYIHLALTIELAASPLFQQHKMPSVASIPASHRRPFRQPIPSEKLYATFLIKLSRRVE